MYKRQPQGHLLIGPPGSGKSTLAAILAPLLPARVIANDVLREQLWGDANVQGPWSEVEPHLHGAIDRAIADGDNVLVDAAKHGGPAPAMDRLVVADTVGSVPGQEPLPPTVRSRGRDSYDAHEPEQPPNRPDLSEGFTSLIRLNPAGPQLSDQINRALQTILDALP